MNPIISIKYLVNERSNVPEKVNFAEKQTVSFHKGFEKHSMSFPNRPNTKAGNNCNRPENKNLFSKTICKVCIMDLMNRQSIFRKE